MGDGEEYAEASNIVFWNTIQGLAILANVGL